MNVASELTPAQLYSAAAAVAVLGAIAGALAVFFVIRPVARGAARENIRLRGMVAGYVDLILDAQRKCAALEAESKACGEEVRGAIEMCARLAEENRALKRGESPTPEQ